MPFWPEDTLLAGLACPLARRARQTAGMSPSASNASRWAERVIGFRSPRQPLLTAEGRETDPLVDRPQRSHLFVSVIEITTGLLRGSTARQAPALTAYFGVPYGRMGCPRTQPAEYRHGATADSITVAPPRPTCSPPRSATA